MLGNLPRVSRFIVEETYHVLSIVNNINNSPSIQNGLHFLYSVIETLINYFLLYLPKKSWPLSMLEKKLDKLDLLMHAVHSGWLKRIF